jgi:hypothetical protein
MSFTNVLSPEEWRDRFLQRFLTLRPDFRRAEADLLGNVVYSDPVNHRDPEAAAEALSRNLPSPRSE